MPETSWPRSMKRGHGVLYHKVPRAAFYGGSRVAGREGYPQVSRLPAPLFIDFGGTD